MVWQIACTAVLQAQDEDTSGLLCSLLLDALHLSSGCQVSLHLCHLSQPQQQCAV